MSLVRAALVYWLHSTFAAPNCFCACAGVDRSAASVAAQSPVRTKHFIGSYSIAAHSRHAGHANSTPEARSNKLWN